MPGYKIDIFPSSIEDKFKCSSCHLVLKNAVQTSCGHRYCSSCIVEILSQPGKHECKVCEEERTDVADSQENLITNDQIFPDKAITRELNGINVNCINAGCDWNGKFKKYEEHVSVCGYEVIICYKRGCDERILRKDLANHLESNCLMRVVQCKYCKDDVTWKELMTHYDNCPKYLITCGFCQRKNIPREKYGDHIDAVKGNCEKKITSCKYKKVGCNDLFEVEKAAEHLTKEQAKHLDLLFYVLTTLMGTVEELKRGIDIPGMTRKTSDNQSKIEKIEVIVKGLEENITDVLRQKGHQKGSKFDLNGLEVIIERQSKNIDELKNKISVLETKVTTYEGIVAVLNSQIERDANVVQILERQRRQDRELLESLERKIKAQDRIIALKDVALAEQDLRIQSLEMASYDGVLVWKISNFHQKRQDALSGRTTSIYSPCFYTSRHGYKMCARIYINGDGMGKGNHVSLFFVIMKGPFDALLRWPFRQKVTFMLLDQNNREHVIDAFRPDPTSNSFKRPTNDMNIASGCPLFMPISQLDSSQHAYVKDDAMFLKIIVDTSDLN